VLVLAGCGGSHRATPTTTAARPAAAPAAIGVVGPLAVDVAASVKRRVTLADIAASKLVLVSARSAGPAEVAAAADAHPEAHFALVGASVAGFRRPNLVGVVLRAEQAAWLGGVAAGLVLTDEGGSRASAAWVGPEEPGLTRQFAGGVHSVAPGATVLRAVAGPRAARCKEAALGVLARGAVVVMAHGGLCAAAAAAAAHDSARPALELSDFELPSAAATTVAREALGGLYHGGEDIVFDSGSGAIGINRLDPTIPPAVAAQIGAAAQELLKSRVNAG